MWKVGHAECVRGLEGKSIRGINIALNPLMVFQNERMNGFE